MKELKEEKLLHVFWNKWYPYYYYLLLVWFLSLTFLIYRQLTLLLFIFFQCSWSNFNTSFTFMVHLIIVINIIVVNLWSKKVLYINMTFYKLCWFYILCNWKKIAVSRNHLTFKIIDVCFYKFCDLFSIIISAIRKIFLILDLAV